MALCSHSRLAAPGRLSISLPLSSTPLFVALIFLPAQSHFIHGPKLGPRAGTNHANLHMARAFVVVAQAYLHALALVPPQLFPVLLLARLVAVVHFAAAAAQLERPGGGAVGARLPVPHRRRFIRVRVVVLVGSH